MQNINTTQPDEEREGGYQTGEKKKREMLVLGGGLFPDKRSRFKAGVVFNEEHPRRASVIEIRTGTFRSTPSKKTNTIPGGGVQDGGQEGNLVLQGSTPSA